jgi:hypothetical protein
LPGLGESLVSECAAFGVVSEKSRRLLDDSAGLMAMGLLVATYSGAHICRMTTDDDHWAEVLRCRRCKETGTAELSQADGQAFHDGDQDVRADSLPDGLLSRQSIASTFTALRATAQWNSEEALIAPKGGQRAIVRGRANQIQWRGAKPCHKRNPREHRIRT